MKITLEEDRMVCAFLIDTQTIDATRLWEIFQAGKQAIEKEKGKA